ncbi:MAG: hypothetical protein V3T23_13440 [Nitrososphaerales archaeon]
MSQTRTMPKDPKNITIIDVLNVIQEIPKEFVGTKEGVAFVSLLSGLLLEQAGYSQLRFRVRDAFKIPGEKFIEELVAKHKGDENKACLDTDPTTRARICELKPRLNVEFDIWPWSNLSVPKSFGAFDLPVPKLLIILGTMGLSAEFIKGMGGIVPG